MYTLGIHYGHHDASVTIVKNGTIIACVSEERFNRIKHYNGFPIQALSFCLEKAKLSMRDIDIVAIPTISTYDKKVEIILGRREKGQLAFAQYNTHTNIYDYIRFAALSIAKTMHGLVEEEPPIYFKRFSYPSQKPIVYLDHHLSHASSAYYTSGFQQKTLVVTADGSGDALSMTIWIGNNGELIPRMKIGNNGSLGLFYSLITEALGWWVGDGEGKTMGLAPYGKQTKAIKDLEKYLPRYKNGKLWKKYNFGTTGAWAMPLGSVHWHFKDAHNVQKLIHQYGAENIAAAAQTLLEREMIALITWWIKREKITHLAAAGGVFLNVKMNQRIWETGLLENFHIYPDAGDAGLSSGAALYCYFKTHKASIPALQTLCWGPDYTDNDIEAALHIRRIPYKKLSKSDLISLAAKELASNKIVGWFQGRMEVGPRALGNRSILANPSLAKNKDIVNARVKYREAFRPFCPSMTPAAAKEFLQNPMKNAKYMIVSFNVPVEKRKKIPAVVHVDGTTRPQVVTRVDNPLFYDLLKEFGKHTGVEVLLNTSFNIKGEPIVCSPSDALKCFIDTGIDYLVMGRYLIQKEMTV